MTQTLEIGSTIKLHIRKRASNMADYDAWGIHDESRINIIGNVQEGEKTTVRIVDYQGGSYFAKSIQSSDIRVSKSEIDEILGSKNDLINGSL